MSNDVQNSMEDRLRGLERSEVQVLYGRCQGLTHGQITAKYSKTNDTWSRNLMTRVFERVGAPKNSSKARKNEFIKTKVCPVLNEILENNESNLDTWPIYGWVVEREGDNVTYREREERERILPSPDAERQPIEKSGLPLKDAQDEELESEPPQEDAEIDDEDTQQEPSEHPSSFPAIPVTNSGPAESAGEQNRGFVWDPPRAQPFNPLLIAVSVLICLGCLVLALTAGNRLRAFFRPPMTFTQTNTSQTPLPTETLPSSPTPSNTSTPQSSPTVEVFPTAIPMPIIENFNKPWNDSWQATGDPILTTAKFGAPFDGVLTTVPGHFATMAVGNRAWTDYIIHIRGYIGDGQFFFGFRVKDLNNMLGIDCDSFACNWVAIRNGTKEVLHKVEDIDFVPEFTLNVEGESFNGSTKDFYARPALLTLPPQYQGQFLNGGVYFRFRDVEIDYIEILPVR
jgi:hypothetical protein